MNFKYYKTTALISSILILSFLIDWLFVNCFTPLLEEHSSLQVIRAPTTTSLIVSIIAIYNEYLWKLPIFNLLVTVPNMNGRYAGKISFAFDNKPNQKDCVIEVTQNASKIKVCSYFNNANQEKTSSVSLIEDIKRGDDGFFTIYLLYLNKGSRGDGKLDSHEGANELKFINSDTSKVKKLEGHYFTDRQVQTRGKIEATFESKTLRGKF